MSNYLIIVVVISNSAHRSKKEVAYMLVPAVGRKVIDLGGNLEKGEAFLTVSELSAK